MCIYIYIYIYIHICTHMCIYIMCVYIYIYIHIRLGGDEGVGPDAHSLREVLRADVADLQAAQIFIEIFRGPLLGPPH